MTVTIHSYQDGKVSVVSAAGSFTGYWMDENEPEKRMYSVEINIPYVYRFCSDRIYILYANDVLKCYNEDAEYLFSVFFERNRNGISSLHVHENELYYEDGCQHHLYHCVYCSYYYLFYRGWQGIPVIASLKTIKSEVTVR